MTALLVVWGVLAMVCAQSPEAEVPAAGRTGEALPANVELNGRYFREYLTDTGAMLASPLHWTGTEWMKAALVAGTAVSLYSVDGDVKREVQKNRTSWSDDTARGARLFGESAYTLPALGAFYLYGEFREDRKSSATALLGLESVVISGVFTTALKSLTHRNRPNTGHSADTWHGPRVSSSNMSFPSMHSASAFSLATVFATEYSDNRYIPPVVYGIATLTALSRINDNEHWASDVCFGSAVGFFTARTICGMHSGPKATVFPVIDGKYKGFKLTCPY